MAGLALHCCVQAFLRLWPAGATLHLRRTGFSLWWPILLQSMGSKARRLQQLDISPCIIYTLNALDGDFPSGAVDGNRPANEGNAGLIPGSGSIPHASEQLSPSAATTEPTCSKERSV